MKKIIRNCFNFIDLELLCKSKHSFGMHRSVENVQYSALHPVRDASLTGCRCRAWIHFLPSDIPYGNKNVVFKQFLNICLVLIGILLSNCAEKTKPIIIDPNLLKYDWVSEKGNYGVTYFLRIEHDTLLFSSLLRAGIGTEPNADLVASYKINYDTLFITSKEYDRYNIYPIRQTTYKFKIVEVDSLKLILKIPPKFTDTLVFKKQIRTKKNELKFERIEYFADSPLGAVSPSQSLSIGSDSILYHYVYGQVFNGRHSKYKLSPVEFSRIENRLHYIDWNKQEVYPSAPGSRFFSLFIGTPNDTIEIYGNYLLDNDDLNDFILYLQYIERFLNLNPIKDEEASFRYGFVE